MAQVIALSVIPSLSREAGGPTFSVPALGEATARAGGKQYLFTVQPPAGQVEHLGNPDVVEAVSIRGFHFPRLRFSWSPSIRSTLRAFCRERGIQVIHSHGIWTQANHAAATVARELGLPLVVSAHGMLQPWAWRHRAWKKRPVWWLWEHRNLKGAALLRATAKQEVESMRRLGLRNPIALIPNGVELPELRKQPGEVAAHFTGQGSQKSGIESSNSSFQFSAFQRFRCDPIKTVVFLGRIHPVKGLKNLVEAWSRVRPSGWRCVLAGPDEAGHQAELEAAIHARNLEDVFEFSGMLGAEKKAELLSAAGLLVQPSFSENFGMSVAEALAAEVPVITTKGTPWEELVTRQCGWWVDVGVEPLVAALRDATSLTDEARLAMGQRGRRLVEAKYAWPQIGRDMLAVYQWVLGQGPMPPCIQTT